LKCHSLAFIRYFEFTKFEILPFSPPCISINFANSLSYTSSREDSLNYQLTLWIRFLCSLKQRWRSVLRNCHLWKDDSRAMIHNNWDPHSNFSTSYIYRELWVRGQWYYPFRGTLSQYVCYLSCDLSFIIQLKLKLWRRNNCFMAHFQFRKHYVRFYQPEITGNETTKEIHNRK
jgi:hypothetical protein